jgi:glycosyltransferase involved in cell wall biosynthesis
MSKLSIAHVLSSFGMGGQERVALDLAKLQREAGHRVLAVSLAPLPEGPTGQAFRDVGVETHTITKHGPSFDPSLAVRLAKYLSGHRTDIVHTHNPHALIYGAPAAALARAACVHSKHGINPDTERRMWLRRAASRMADAYVAVTPSLARVALSNNECDPAHLHVINNGIDTRKFAPDPDARLRARAELGIPDDAWVVGTVGRLAPEKNQGLLIDAMAPMLERRRHLVLVGDGPERADLERRAAGTWRPEFIHFTGARNDTPALMAAFDAFALTSSSEGLPLVLLEAMATRLPVVATAVGGVPDLVQDGVTGYLVDAGDWVGFTKKLIWLSTHAPEALVAASVARRAVLDKHSVEHMARDYENLYRRVARGARGASRARAVEAEAPLVVNGS